MQTKQTDLARLLIGTKVFVVPQFQRHYRWKKTQWLELYEDIVAQYESPDVQSGNPMPGEGHFIGSVVLHPAPGPASTVARYWVIDGQQRLTTLLALLAALRDVRQEADPTWNPDQYTNVYLGNQYNEDQPYRLVPGDNDRDDFISTVYESRPAGQIGDAYKWLRRSIEGLASSRDFDYGKFENAVLLRLIVVEINTSDDDNINQIFNTINYSGMRLSAIDLIRNHSFMQFDSEEASEVYREIWQPLEDRLVDETLLSQYFWAQLVRRNPKATQRDLYAPFQKSLEDIRRSTGEGADAVARQELERFTNEAPLFLSIVSPHDNEVASWSENLRRAVTDLHHWGSMTHLPMTLEVLSRVHSGEISDADATTALRYLLSYLVRRGICAIPTNNLNRILSAIPSSLGSGSISDQVASELLRGSKYWPTDAEVIDRGLTSPLYLTLQKGQIRFILRKLNDSLEPAARVSHEDLTVEHIMPPTTTEAWKTMLDEQAVPAEVAQARLHVLGNLTLAAEVSIPGQLPPGEKAAILRASSLAINRSAGVGDVWAPRHIDQRSNDLLKLAVQLWPRPSGARVEPNSDLVPLLPETFTVANLLEAIPPDTWIAVSDLARIAGLDRENTVRQVAVAGFHVRDGVELTSEIEGVPGLTDLDGFDFATAKRISADEAVGALESVGSQTSDRV